MTTDADEVRVEVESLLAELPDPESPDADLEVIAARLERAHEVLVEALHSVQRHPASRTEPGSASSG